MVNQSERGHERSRDGEDATVATNIHSQVFGFIIGIEMRTCLYSTTISCDWKHCRRERKAGSSQDARSSTRLGNLTPTRFFMTFPKGCGSSKQLLKRDWDQQGAERSLETEDLLCKQATRRVLGMQPRDADAAVLGPSLFLQMMFHSC